MKVVLIVFGSLFSLMIIAIIGVAIVLPILGKKLYAQSHDPATRARTAAKIADFRVPPGYMVQSATDFGFSHSAIIGPRNPLPGATHIQLTGERVIATNSNQALNEISVGLQLSAKLLNCHLERGGDDVLRLDEKTFVLRNYGCDDGSDTMYAEIGQVQARASTVDIVATARHGALDKTALYALVSSIR